MKALKTLIVIATISITTTVFAQISGGDAAKNAPAKKEELPEAVRTEIRSFNEKIEAINSECRKRRDELRANLSPEAKRIVQEHKDRKKRNNREQKQDQDQKAPSAQAAPTSQAAPKDQSTPAKN